LQQNVIKFPVLEELNIALTSELKKKMNSGIFTGLNPKQVSSEIYKTMGSGVTRKDLETLTRTYALQAGSTAREVMFKKNEDVIKNYV
jgi:hypothetical protein